jgi:hypothetical protein
MVVSIPTIKKPFTGVRKAIGQSVKSIRNRFTSPPITGNGPIATIQRGCKQIGPLGGILLLTQLMILIKDVFAVDALNHFFQFFSHKIKKNSVTSVDSNTPKAINTESLANKELVCVVIDAASWALQLITALYVRLPLIPSATQGLLMMTANYLKGLVLKEEDKMIIAQSDLLDSNNNEINPAEESAKPRADDNNIDNKKAQGGGENKDDDKNKNLNNGQNPNGGGLTNPNLGAGGMGNGGIPLSGMPNSGAGGLVSAGGAGGINTNGAPVYIRYDHNGGGSLVPSLGKIN